MTIKKWVIQVAATLAGATLATGAQAVGAAGSAAGSSAGSLSAFSWLSNVSGSATNAITRLGTSLGGETGANLIMNAESIGSAISTLGNGLGYLNSVVAISQGKWGQGLGAAVGTYFGGPIGSMIGSAIGSALDKYFGGGGPKSEFGYSTGALTNVNGHMYGTGAASLGYGGAQDPLAKSTLDTMGAIDAESVLAALDELSTRIEEVRTAVEQAVINTSRTNKTIDRLAPAGDAMQVRVVA